MSDDTPGKGRHLASPAFPDDDGAADAAVQELVEGLSRGTIDPVTAARELRSARLLAVVKAVLDAMDESGGDKDSHMAVVSMLSSDGRKGMLAFTGIDAVSAWDPEARPVPVLGRDLARAAIDDGADAVVIDVAGPQRAVLSGPLLLALAAQVDLEAVDSLVQSALAPLTSDGWCEVTVAGIDAPDAQVDVLVSVAVRQGGHPDGRSIEQLTQQAAKILSARPDIHALAPGGLAVTPRL